MEWRLIRAQSEGGGTYPELDPGLKLSFLSSYVIDRSGCTLQAPGRVTTALGKKLEQELGTRRDLG